MIKEILIGMFVWFTIFQWHELMHALAGHFVGVKEHYIRPVFKPIPTMKYQYYGKIKNKEIISLSGGTLSSMIAFGCSILSTGVWQFAFFLLGWINLIYGIYEWKYIREMNPKQYTQGRYIIYLIITIIILFIYLIVRK
jgi:hypothetical protein